MGKEKEKQKDVSEVLKEVKEKIKTNRAYKLSYKKATVISNKIIVKIKQVKSWTDFFEENISEFKKMYRYDSNIFSDTLLEIAKWLIYNKYELFEEFKLNHIYARITGRSSDVKTGKSLSKLMDKTSKNNPDFFYYKLLMTIDTQDSNPNENLYFANEYKSIIKNYPKLNKFINDCTYSIYQDNLRKIRICRNKINELENDRILLYELSKKVSDEDKYNVIIDGIKKKFLKLSNLKMVADYLFKKIPDRKLRKKPITQLTEYLFTELNKQFTKSTIQTTLLTIKK